MSFRFILQPSMAAIAAIHDGVKDARTGRSPFLDSRAQSRERVERLREGLIATARIILLGIAMDVIYQSWYSDVLSGEALLIALLLPLFLPADPRPARVSCAGGAAVLGRIR